MDHASNKRKWYCKSAILHDFGNWKSKEFRINEWIWDLIWDNLSMCAMSFVYRHCHWVFRHVGSLCIFRLSILTTIDYSTTVNTTAPPKALLCWSWSECPTKSLLKWFPMRRVRAPLYSPPPRLKQFSAACGLKCPSRGMTLMIMMMIAVVVMVFKLMMVMMMML